jgi:hypothetical protein
VIGWQSSTYKSAIFDPIADKFCKGVGVVPRTTRDVTGQTGSIILERHATIG